ncbi:MAG: methyltransferase domain-containing protein [Candidatus Omnitrophota bacterium]
MDLKECSSSTQRHPWELARVKMLRRLFSKFSSASMGLRILDIGCGDGFVLAELSADAQVAEAHGLDIHLNFENIAAMTRGKMMFFNDPRFLQGKYDFILLCDVLEHVEDDGGFLQGFVDRHASAGAVIILTVPAFQFLFSAHDRHLAHYRRYSPARLRAVIHRAGLVPFDHGSMFGVLLWPRLWQCLKEKVSPGRQKDYSGIGRWGGGRILSGIITAILDFDNLFLIFASCRGIRFPGLTIWSVAKKAA